MIKKLLFLFLPLFFFGGISAQNLALNGGFETWTSDTQPEGWTTAMSISKETAIMHNGSFSAKQTSISSTLKLSQEIAVEAGKTYTISYWYLDNDVNAKTRIWSAWMNGTSALTDNIADLQSTTYSTDSPDWKQFLVTLTAPETATAFRFEVRSYKGTAEGGFIYFDDFNLSTAGASTNADILTFIVANQQGASIIDEVNKTVLITMPQGSNISALSPVITVSPNATISPASGTAHDFSAPVIYSVTAEDGTTIKNWTATVELVEPIIVLFEDDFETGNLEKWTALSVIGDQIWKIDDTHGVGGSKCAKVSGYSGGSFENEDWLITPVMDLSGVLEAKLSFSTACNYNGNDIEVKYSTNYSGSGAPSVATWTDLTATLSTGSWAWTSSGDIDISAITSTTATFAFIYTSTVTESKTWELDLVKIVAKPNELPSTETDITGFSFAEQTSAAVIDSELHKISIEVANGVPVNALVPTIELSLGATINPASGVAQDFSTDVTYIVTAEDGTTTQNWTVSVTVATLLSNAAEILTFTLEQEVAPAVINSETATVSSLVKWDTDLTDLSPSITISFGAQITPTTITDFTVPVKYLVTAQDGITEKEWTVTITNAEEPNHDAEIIGFELSQLTGPAVINSENGTITGEVSNGTNVTNLLPTISISEGAIIAPTTAHDFTNTVVYTVTAEDGTTQKTWNVSLTVKAAELVSIYNIQFTESASGASPLIDKIVKTKGVVTGKDSKSIFIQDGTGAWKGINVYKGSAIEANLGDSVLVEGKIAEYKMLTEITSPVVTVINSGNVIPDAISLTNNDFKQEKYEGVIVKINSVTCSTIVDANGNWSVVDNASSTIIVRNQLFVFTPELGQSFSFITGIGTQFNADYQLLPRSAEDILINSVSDKTFSQISVYPNPFTNVLTFENLNSTSSFSISNILGETIMSNKITQNNLTINTSELNKGIYIITFEGMNGKKYSERIIKY